METINNSETSNINRGVEIIIKRRNPSSKTFLLCFEKVVSFFNRKITIYFNFSFDIRKQK
jgi:hypothetical protein